MKGTKLLTQSNPNFLTRNWIQSHPIQSIWMNPSHVQLCTVLIGLLNVSGNVISDSSNMVVLKLYNVNPLVSFDLSTKLRLIIPSILFATRSHALQHYAAFLHFRSSLIININKQKRTNQT